MSLKLHEYNETVFGGGCIASLDKAVNIEVTENLQQPHTLNFEYPLYDDKADMIVEHRIVSVEGQAYRLVDVKRDYSGKRITASATRIFFIDAIYRHLPTIGSDNDKNKDTIGCDPYKVLRMATEGTKFKLISDSDLAKLGMTRIGADGTRIDFFVTDKINLYDAIQAVIDAYGHGEIYVDNYNFAVVEEIGRDNGVRLSLKKNLINLNVERQTSELITRFYPYGADDLTISSVNDGKPYLDSPEAIKQYGIVEGYLDYSDYTDPDKLKAHAEWDLMGENNPFRKDTPQLTITGDVIDLSKLAEYGDFEKIALGDTVHVQEKDIVHHKRIIGITYYPYSVRQPKVTIGSPNNKNMFFAAWQKNKLFKTVIKNRGSNYKVRTGGFTGSLNSTQNNVKSENDLLKIVGDLLAIRDKNKRIRIRLGNYDDEFVFIIYDKKNDRAIYLNEEGEAVFSGSIQTKKDCFIQGELRVGMSGNNAKGISFYGDAYAPDKDGNYSRPYARIQPYVANNEDFTGINVTGGKLCIEESPVATQDSIDNLNKQISNLKKQLDSMS